MGTTENTEKIREERRTRSGLTMAVSLRVLRALRGSFLSRLCPGTGHGKGPDGKVIPSKTSGPEPHGRNHRERPLFRPPVWGVRPRQPGSGFATARRPSYPRPA